MSSVVSTVTSKGQATIPVDIRKKLHLNAGDKVTFRVQADQVVVEKTPPLDRAYLEALESTLQEWNSEADNQAYNDL